QNNSYFSTGGELGRRPTNLNFSLQVQNGTVSIYFLDEFGFNQYNHSLPFENLLQTPMIDVTNTSGTIIAEDEIRILGNYHLVIENNGDSNATINVAIEMTSSIFVGYTWKIMHEIGHAVGLNHPHDGYSYGNYDHPDAAAGIYLNWLWDMSYTQMNYANQAPEISLMDIDTLQREVTPRVWNDGLLRMSEITNESMSTYGAIPSTVLEHLNDALALFNQSVEYYKDSSSLDNYNRSIRAAYDMWSALGQASDALLSEASANRLMLIGIGVGGVLIVAIPIIYYVIKRRS
ncbi:MAG: M66 family metalloprotease, partial [Candidatus Thorarchaeota archaeon]